jgi:hypothetical protein
MRSARLRIALALGVVTAAAGACGSSSSPGPTTTAGSATATIVSAPATGGGSGSGPGGTGSGSSSSTSSGGPASSPPPSTGGGALSAESASAAAGDIPDNQVFLVFADQAAGYSLKYPEGWAQKGDAGDVTFRDKNNIAHVVITPSASAPSVASVASDLERAKAAAPSLKAGPPTRVDVHGASAIRATYTTTSDPNPVTGKRVSLTVDRYVLAHAGQIATIDLGSPRGVDNVDAYRLMIESFRWTR